MFEIVPTKGKSASQARVQNLKRKGRVKGFDGAHILVKTLVKLNPALSYVLAGRS